MATPFFPDNQNRSDRVNQLINQTSTIQSDMSEIETGMMSEAANALPYLDQIATEAGYPSVEEYVEASQRVLSPAEKLNYASICSHLISLDPKFVDGVYISGGVGSIGVLLNIGVPKIVNIICKFSTFIHGMKGVLRGLIMIFRGAVEDGMATVKTFATLLRANYRRALVVGDEVGTDIGTTLARNLRWLGRAGKVLQWAGVMAEVALLIFGGVEGEKEKRQLEAAITETFATRFSVKKIQLLLVQTQTWQSMAASLVTTKAMMTKVFEPQQAANGSATGSTTTNPPLPPLPPNIESTINTEIQNQIDQMINPFDEQMKSCNTDEVVTSLLATLDANAAEPAWTNEDPTIDQVKAWIAAHPMTDNNGDVISPDGPSFDESGLVWSSTSVNSNSQAQTVTITGFNQAGENPSPLAQCFGSIAISLGVPGTAATSTLFTGTSYGVSGGGGSPDVTVSVTGSSGVTGLGAATVSAVDTNGYVKIVVGTATGSPSIKVPGNGSITFTFTGNTSAAGQAGLLAHELWYPANNKSWADVNVQKN
ncbi:hypothetical protein TWF718_004424 [Orbilia javanica]|uniref:Uncharacterized protein n=1 Tax=Orbilia javanica TaxID=47235 RepID=A0AAN8MXS7_9PEZI